jgi:hypothetical protein
VGRHTVAIKKTQAFEAPIDRYCVKFSARRSAVVR